MKALLMVAIAMAAMLAGPRYASAQNANGFVGMGMLTTVNGEQIPGIAGGGVLDLAGSWVSVGGQGDLLFKNGYVGGRGGPIAQLNFVRYRGGRLFAIGGMAWGVESSPMVGAGVEVWSGGALGLRAAVQTNITRIQGADCSIIRRLDCDTHFNGGNPYTAYKPSFHFAVAWR